MVANRIVERRPANRTRPMSQPVRTPSEPRLCGQPGLTVVGASQGILDRWQTRTMKAMEATTNLHTDDVERAREFFRFLGLTEDGMDQGWVARFTSADSGACVQVVTRDATAPEDSAMTIKVDDVDAAYEEAQQRGYEIVHPITDEPWGIRRFFVRSPDGQVINVARHR
jgi:predicted enzyme related to lactoylglutathione lyase